MVTSSARPSSGTLRAWRVVARINTRCHADMSLGQFRSEKSPDYSAFPRKMNAKAERIGVLMISCEMLRKQRKVTGGESGSLSEQIKNSQQTWAFFNKAKSNRRLHGFDCLPRFRPFAAVFRFCERNDTQNDTRRGCLPRVLVANHAKEPFSYEGSALFKKPWTLRRRASHRAAPADTIRSLGSASARHDCRRVQVKREDAAVPAECPSAST